VDKSLKASRKGAIRRPNFPIEFKRKLVEESLAPEASVALIARRNDINANMLYKWRRQQLTEISGETFLRRDAAAESDTEFSTLMPVSIVDATSRPTSAAPDKSASAENICEVEFDRARLRIHGEVSPATLRLLIRELSQ